jgi:hypothetical protein
MCTKQGIGKSRKNLEPLSDRMEHVSLNSIRQILPDTAILEACRAVGHVFRKRKITPILTVLHMILSAIWPEESFNASWQVLWDSFAGHSPGAAGKSPSTGSVAKARDRLPVTFWHHLFDWLGQKVRQASAVLDTWRGHRVILMDGTCVSMADEPELRKEFGVNRGYHGKGKFPLARLTTLALANTMMVVAYAVGRYEEGETHLLGRMLKTLHHGDLLVGDRHFAGSNLYAAYQREGLEFLTRAHQKLNISRLKPITIYGKNDFTAYLKLNKIYRRKDPTLPKDILVRLIQVVVRNRGKRQVIWLVTSLLDAEQYPAAEITELYGKRWRIETLFFDLKIRLSADVLRSTSPHGIYKELAAHMIAVNIVRLIMLEAAITYQVEPNRISFVHALRAIISFAPALAFEPIWKLPDIYREMLHQIASHQVPKRPGRNEPRMIRRETKHYPTLKITRKEWRLNVA